MKILKALIIVVLTLVALPAIAVSLRSDPTPGATHCGLYKNAVFDADYVVADVGGGNGCLFTIDVQAPGSTIVYTATAVVNDARWGRVESPQSLPLSVARPAPPTRPAWNAIAVRPTVSATSGTVTTRPQLGN